MHPRYVLGRCAPPRPRGGAPLKLSVGGAARGGTRRTWKLEGGGGRPGSDVGDRYEDRAEPDARHPPPIDSPKTTKE